MVSDKLFNKFKQEVIDLEENNYTVIRKPTKEEIELDKTLNTKVLIRHNNNKYSLCNKSIFNGMKKEITIVHIKCGNEYTRIFKKKT